MLERGQCFFEAEIWKVPTVAIETVRMYDNTGVFIAVYLTWRVVIRR